MRRFSTICAAIATLTVLAVGLVGCDSSPNSVEDFDVQGTMESPPALTVTPSLQPEFDVTYQGLTSPPTVNPTGRLEVDTVGAPEGDPEQGGRQRYQISLAVDNIDQLLAQEPVTIVGNTTQGGQVVDTVRVAVSTTLSVKTDFTSSFAAFADYEGDVTIENYELAEGFTEDSVDTDMYEGGQRNIVTSGGTSFSVTNPDPDPGLPSVTANTPEGSNGIRFMEVAGSSDGSLTIERRANLPNSDFFSFLIRPATSAFELTITLTEETGGGTASHDLTLPIPAGDQWLKVGVPLASFSEDLSPVDSRSGGDGPLVSVKLSADQSISYAVDEMLFGIETPNNDERAFLPRAEIHDFEETNLAYGPSINTANTYEFSTVGVDSNPQIADASDGYTSRRLVSGGTSFGYDYGGGQFPPPDFIRVDADSNDVLSFFVKDVTGDTELTVELRSSGGFFKGVSRSGFSQGEWERVEIPIPELGDGEDGDPAVALDPGIAGIDIGTSNGSEFLIDDIKIMPKE